MLKQTLDYYSERLFKSPDALEYLKMRGVHDIKALERFRIGFADRTLGLRLPDGSRKTGEKLRGMLKKCGLHRETERIHVLQRQARTLEGLKLRKGKRRLLNLLRNVQRLLRP